MEVNWEGILLIALGTFQKKRAGLESYGKQPEAFPGKIAPPTLLLFLSFVLLLLFTIWPYGMNLFAFAPVKWKDHPEEGTLHYFRDCLQSIVLCMVQSRCSVIICEVNKSVNVYVT